MAAQYTAGNPKYAEFDAAARAALESLDALRRSLLKWMDADIAAYDAYRLAVALPKNSAEEKSARSAALAAAREESTRVPETILAAALDGLQHVDALSRAVNPNLAGDVASSAYFLEACARGAAIQVFSNCAADDAAGNNANRRRATVETVARCQALREQIHAAVLVLLKISE